MDPSTVCLFLSSNLAAAAAPHFSGSFLFRQGWLRGSEKALLHFCSTQGTGAVFILVLRSQLCIGGWCPALVALEQSSWPTQGLCWASCSCAQLGMKGSLPFPSSSMGMFLAASRGEGPGSNYF